MIRTIFLYAVGFLIFTLAVFCFLFNSNQPVQLGCATHSPQYFCGTKDTPQDAVAGKEVFNRTCAACHKLDAKSTGPALRNTDSIIFKKWIIERNAKIDTTKLYKQAIDYHRYLAKESMDSLDIENLYHFINRKPVY
ncbi:c-type cytochrome [Flavobacterium reichenbachii]|uniref:c-type cytochrome n=1 Tax=Flavobacterium reichenbachii TaxID=362418 RepID=UPI00054F8ABA